MDAPPRTELCWVDAFPWLRSEFGQHKAELGGLDPWEEVPGNQMERENGIGVVRDVALDLLTAGWTFLDLFPKLPATRAIADLNLSSKTVDALTRGGVTVAQNLASASMRDVSIVWGLGGDARDSLVFGLTAASLQDVSDDRVAEGLARNAGAHHVRSGEFGKSDFSGDHVGEPVWLSDDLQIGATSPSDREESLASLSVRRGATVRGKVAVAARFRVPNVIVDGDAALVRLPLGIAQKAIRQKSAYEGDAQPPDVCPTGAVVVRAKGNWFLEGNELGIVKAADLIAGDTYLAAAIAAQADSVLCLALFAEARQGDIAYLDASGAAEQAQVGTNTERLTVTTRPIVVTIQSEPFVTPTRFGYTPAVLVSKGSSLRQHLLVSAKSLGDPLEEIRVRRGGLTGTVVELKKESDERSSKYLVSERASES